MAKKPVKDELMNHEFDGIQELDNLLPPWWLWLFYITIIWGVGYMIYYHVLGAGPLQAEQYQQEVEQAEMLSRQNAPSQEEDMAAFTDAENLANGKEVYMTHCFPCHGQYGEGTVGPNMTDDYWIHGGKFPEIVKTITVGVPAKGMISWSSTLRPEQINQVASYILTLRGTNPPNPKAPEGDLVKYEE